MRIVNASTLVGFALMSAVLSGFSYGLFSVGFPFLLHDVNATFLQISLAESASMILAFAVLSKTLKTRVKVLGVIDTFILIATRFLFTLSYNPIQALSTYVVGYIASAVYDVIVVSAVLDSVKKYRATSLGMISSLKFIVSSASPIVGASLMSFTGVRGLLLTNAFLAVGYLPLVLKFTQAPEKEVIELFELAHKYKYSLLFVLIMSLGGFLGSMYVTYERILGVYLGAFPAWVIGAYTSIESILITVTTPIIGFITDKIRKRFMIPVMNDILNIPYALSVIHGATSKNLLLYLSAPIYDALMSATSTTSTALLKDLKAPTRQLIALNDALGNLSAAAGAIFAGYLLDVGGAYLTLNIIVYASIITIIVDLIALPKLYKIASKK
jgi:hypothetical protein